MPYFRSLLAGRLAAAQAPDLAEWQKPHLTQRSQDSLRATF